MLTWMCFVVSAVLVFKVMCKSCSLYGYLWWLVLVPKYTSGVFFMLWPQEELITVCIAAAETWRPYLQIYLTLITFCSVLLNATQCCRNVLINSVLQPLVQVVLSKAMKQYFMRQWTWNRKWFLVLRHIEVLTRISSVFLLGLDICIFLSLRYMKCKI